MSAEAERLVELFSDLGGRLNGVLRDVVPPDAQAHLLNAQRELLTALFLIYEHQSGARRRPGGRPAPRPRRAASPPARVRRIPLD